jgi:squalene-hopene/tetraprenyl-beta-curcumene cyclase
MFNRCALLVGVGLLFGLAAPPTRAEDKPPDYPKPEQTSPDEPRAAKLSLAKAGEYLDGVAVNWTRERKCGTCHTNYPYLMGRPACGGPAPGLEEVRKFFEERVAGWDTDKGKPRWDTEVVATAVALAVNDAQTTGKLHPLTRKALDKMWTVQQDNGAWNWIKCDWPPMEHDDYFGATYAAVGVGTAPDEYAKADSAKEGLSKLRKYLKENSPPDLHHKTWLLWASTKLDGLMTPAEREATVKELLALQRADGGWALPSLGTWKRRDGTANDKDAPSDGYATGLVVYVLRQAGLPATDEKVQRGVKWLQTNQRASGRWYTRSLNNDKAHYITNAGTSFAVLALAACETPGK